MIIQINGTEFNHGLVAGSYSCHLCFTYYLEVYLAGSKGSFWCRIILVLSAFILLSELQIVDSSEVGTQRSLLPQYGNFKCLHKFYQSAFSQE